jgi:pSer/pThr/pTyr-binding forkhead associated (FHA) protein
LPEQPPNSPLDVPTQPGKRPKKSKELNGRLVVLRGPQAGQEFTLQPGINVFGREEGNIVRDVRVSRRHTQIEQVAGEFLLVDLQSTNGTFVNGERITQATLLMHGDTIRIGDTILVLKIEGQGLHDPAVIGARTPDLTEQGTDGTTILADRAGLAPRTRTDVPRFDVLREPEASTKLDPEKDD